MPGAYVYTPAIWPPLVAAIFLAAVAPATEVTWYKFHFVVLVIAVTPATCFVLDYAYPARWLTRRNQVLLSIPPLLCLLMAVIDDSRLIWRRRGFRAAGSCWVRRRSNRSPATSLPFALTMRW